MKLFHESGDSGNRHQTAKKPKPFIKFRLRITRCGFPRPGHQEIRSYSHSSRIPADWYREWQPQDPWSSSPPQWYQHRPSPGPLKNGSVHHCRPVSRDGPVPWSRRRYLQLDCSKAKAQLGWSSKLPLPSGLEWTVSWYKNYQHNEDMRDLTLEEISRYQKLQS